MMNGIRRYVTKLKYSLAKNIGRDARVIRPFFNEKWYLDKNKDVRDAGIDPVVHYILYGWKEGRDPTPGFSTLSYLQNNASVHEARINPFVHYLTKGIRTGYRPDARLTTDRLPATFNHAKAFHSVQDQSFPVAAETAENIMVIIVPEHNTMSGGIYSFFSIARTAYNLRFKHDYLVLLMTRPNKYDVTYTRQRNFRNSEDVFRFEQIQRCRSATNIYIHVPEYAAPDFCENLDEDLMAYLKSREKLNINILNQKTDIMPEKEDLEEIRSLAHELTQSVAHHAYFSQAFADRYDLPTLLLPAYTDLSGYEKIPFAEKEKLIIYSPDTAPWKKDALEVLKRELPDYRLLEISGITFDRFMDLATRCQFSITFGEGFDGYLAQPIHQGGVGFAVYNEDFFPTPDLLDFNNIFSSPEDLVKNIVPRIKALTQDLALYEETNVRMIKLYDGLYSPEDYRERVMRLIDRQFEYYPIHAGSHFSYYKPGKPAQA